MTEADFIAALRTLPLHPAARMLADDIALLGGMAVTTDTLVEGVHFLPDDPPGDIAWKLVATNLSDLAAKGSSPTGILLNYPLSGDDWDRAFLDGLRDILATYDCPLIGGGYRVAACGRAALPGPSLRSATAAPPRRGPGRKSATGCG